MKKGLSIILALVLMLSLSAVAFAENEVDAIKKAGVLTVALSPDFSPMEFVDSTKEGQDAYVGFDVTLAKNIAAYLGVDLEIQAMSFDACQTAVAMDAVDMSISGYSWTLFNAGLGEGNPADFGIPTLEEYDWDTVKLTCDAYK